jgi:hypothetical protein
MATAAATAAAVAIPSLHPRRRPSRELIVMLPFLTAEPAGVVVDEPSDATAVDTPARDSIDPRIDPQPMSTGLCRNVIDMAAAMVRHSTRNPI